MEDYSFNSFNFINVDYFNSENLDIFLLILTKYFRDYNVKVRKKKGRIKKSLYKDL